MAPIGVADRRGDPGVRPSGAPARTGTRL